VSSSDYSALRCLSTLSQLRQIVAVVVISRLDYGHSILFSLAGYPTSFDGCNRSGMQLHGWFTGGLALALVTHC